MNGLRNRVTSIRDRIGHASNLSARFLWGSTAGVCLADVLRGTSLGGRLPELSGKSVLIATRDQLATALTLVELDGVARRLVIGTPDLSSEDLHSVIAQTGVDAIVSDYDPPSHDRLGVPLRVTCRVDLRPARVVPFERCPTEWVLLTSGTTGRPKMIAHTVASLTAAIGSDEHREAAVWGTFYDMRRYGGLQIFLRAMLGPASLVLSSLAESPGDFLLRLGARGVTHVSGTPSHWRRALMSPRADALTPRYVRLSGEIADQAILTALRSFYPQAVVAHAFASTEAGVGFEVDDGLEGFPASLVGAGGRVEMKIEHGSLRIRSDRIALRCIGHEPEPIADADGFVDTGDTVERRGDRYHFLGRRSGVINVGGLKVYPEEVEAVISHHPAVRMSRVRSRRSPLTGSLVAADIVLHERAGEISSNSRIADCEREILQLCHERLAAHKIPATIRFVPALDLGPTGKLARAVDASVTA